MPRPVKYPEITLAAKRISAVAPADLPHAARIRFVRSKLIEMNSRWGNKASDGLIINALKRPLPTEALLSNGIGCGTGGCHPVGDRNGDSRLVPVTCLEEVAKLRQRFGEEEIADALRTINTIQALKLCTVTSHVSP